MEVDGESYNITAKRLYIAYILFGKPRILDLTGTVCLKPPGEIHTF